MPEGPSSTERANVPSGKRGVMSTQGTGARRRSKLSAALVALALIVAVFVLAAQANSISSTRIGPQDRLVKFERAGCRELQAFPKHGWICVR
jgi:hypothetical protein